MRLQHVSVVIERGRDDEARAFYGGLLGLEERAVPPKLPPDDLIWFRVGGDDLELHLVKGDEVRNDLQHFCLVTDDLDAIRARLEEAGVGTRDATEIVGRPRFFCHDPFGNLVELTHIERYE